MRNEVIYDPSPIEVRRLLNVLMGLPLTDLWGYAEFLRFEFGEQKPFINKRGQPAARSDYGLLVSAQWRLEGPDGIVYEADEWEKHVNVRNVLDLPRLLNDAGAVVRKVVFDGDHVLQISFSAGFVFTVYPLQISEESFDIWMFMTPTETLFFNVDDISLLTKAP